MKKRVLSLFLAITLCLTLTPTGALAAEGQPPEQTVSVTQEAQTGADENAPPAKPEENPTENSPAAAEKNTADEETDEETDEGTGKETGEETGKEAGEETGKEAGEETGKQAVQNEPTMEGKNELLALNDAEQNAADNENGEAGGTSISEEDTRTEIWCTSKPDSIGRGYDGTTDGGTIPIDLTFTDGTNEIKLKEGTDFTAKKTFDSADAGWHTVTVEIALIGEAAVKYKLKAGEETFTIGGNINKAYKGSGQGSSLRKDPGGRYRRQRDLHRRQPASGPERDQTLFRQCGKCGRSVPDRLYRSDQGHRQF